MRARARGRAPARGALGWRVALVLFSAALYTLAFPPWGFDRIAWIALVPFLYAIAGLRARSAAAAGLLWGTATIWGIGYWVPLALATYWGQSLWFGIAFAMAGAVVFVGSYGAGFAASSSLVVNRCSGILRVTLVASLWVSWELARGRLLTGDPWLLIGYAVSPHPLLIQVAELGRVYLVSFIVAFANAAVFDAIRSRRPVRTVTAAVVLVCLAAGYGAIRTATPLPGTPAVPVLVVQGNNAPGGQWRQEYYGRGLEEYLRLSAKGAARTRPAVIVWPESAVTFFLAHEPQYRKLIGRLLTESGADLLVGAPHHEGDDPLRPQFYNSAFYVSEQGDIADRYDKNHLLPFGEYFPLRTIELLRRRFERVRYFTAGKDTKLLDTRLGKAAVVICFEAIFPELVRARMARGAEVLVNLSNDAWLGTDAGPRQHMAMISMRAVENRTWVVRATTTGVSAIIDPFGRVRAHTGTGTAAVLEGSIVPMRVSTVYKRFGDVFAYACLLVSVAGCAAALGRMGMNGQRDRPLPP